MCGIQCFELMHRHAVQASSLPTRLKPRLEGDLISQMAINLGYMDNLAITPERLDGAILVPSISWDIYQCP